MDCRQCQGIETFFSKNLAAKELKGYRKKGPAKTTRLLIEALKAEGIEGMTLLDIGGGVGAIQHELLKDGAESAISVEASSAYVEAAKEEAERQGHANRLTQHHGNFVDIVPDIPPADIVTLDRVICCYHDMQALVGLSSAKASRFYGVVYPRDIWWVRIGFAVMNIGVKVLRNPFRGFVHPTKEVDEVVSGNGLKQRFYRKTLIWQVVLYAR